MNTKANVISTAALRIREARLQTGITQDLLGNMSYVSPTAIMRLELAGNGSLALVGAVLNALLRFDKVQALGEGVIAPLRASYDEIHNIAGADTTKNRDVYPLTPVQIKGIRKILGMTQHQLSGVLLLGNSSSVSQWESLGNPRVPRAFHRVKLVQLGTEVVGSKAGLTGKAAEDLLFSTLELMAGPVVQADESENGNSAPAIINWQSIGSAVNAPGTSPSAYTPSGY